MAKTEANAYEIVVGYSLPFTAPLVSDSRSLKNPKNVIGLYERQAMSDSLLIPAQQAYLGMMLYRFGVPMSSALPHIARPETRADVKRFVETTRTVHAATGSTTGLPRKRGVVALGILRSSVEVDLRDKALAMLAQDPTSYAIYQANLDLYTGLKPAEELSDVLAYLNDPTNAENIESISPHLNTWLQWLPAQE